MSPHLIRIRVGHLLSVPLRSQLIGVILIEEVDFPAGRTDFGMQCDCIEKRSSPAFADANDYCVWQTP